MSDPNIGMRDPNIDMHHVDVPQHVGMFAPGRRHSSTGVS